MHDLRRLRSEPDPIRAGLSTRGDHDTTIDSVLALDAEQRGLAVERDEIRARIKQLSKEVGGRRRDGDNDGAEALQAESRSLGETEADLADRAGALDGEIRELLLGLPNLPSDDAPIGSSEADNQVVASHGDPGAAADHQRVPHWESAVEAGMLDVERGTKLSGSMFVMYRGAGATLARALCQLGLDRNADAYEEVRPPSLVRSQALIGSGNLPKFADDAYRIENDDLWAIPTAEVPLTSLAAGEVLDEADLPMRFMAHTSCFRREAGSAGRDTRGLLRLHEFDKVELLAYATPDQAPAAHQDILDRACALIADLGLPYRILDLCTGDLGFSSRRTFDVEVFAPGADRWLEVSSVSWFGDFQARRANLRYRPSDGGKPQFLHTLNGSGLAVPRVWAAVVEHGRQADGSIRIPEVLHPYMRGVTEIPAG